MDSEHVMKKCKCGAYRAASIFSGEWVAGCRACDTIERLYVLLDGGVRVSTRESPSRLRERVRNAEREVDRLQAKIDIMEEDHPKELKRNYYTCPKTFGRIPESCTADYSGFDMDRARQLLIRMNRIVQEEGDSEDLLAEVDDAMDEAREMLGIGEDWN